MKLGEIAGRWLWTAGLLLAVASCALTERAREAQQPRGVAEQARAEPAVPSPAPPEPAPEPAVAEPPPPPLPPPVITRISAVGDIMLDGKARPYLQRYGYDYAFARVRPLFARSDLVIGNLEGPLTAASQPMVDKKYLFRSPARPVAAALARAGIGAVSLANNHTLDYGLPGLRDTTSVLRDAGIRFFGAGESLAAARTPAIVETGAIRIGLLGYSNTFPDAFWADRTRGGTAFGHEAQLRDDVAALADRVDIVVVSFHWGREGTTELRPYQPLLARAAIDAGADLVIGHHPHVLQAIERYRGGVILYSLGNFTFGSFSTRATVGAVAHVQFANGAFDELVLQPLNVNNFEVYFQPRPLTAQRAVATFEHLRELSRATGTELYWRGGDIVHPAQPVASLPARPGCCETP